MAKILDQQKAKVNGFNVDKPLFPIGIVAESLKVHQRTLRIYDEEGLLVPSRSQKNRRVYSYCDLQKGKLIQLLTRELGVNLAGTKIILNLLSKENIFDEKAIEYIKKLAYDIDITPEMLEQNKIKYAKRGRRKS